MSSIFHGGNTYIFYNTDANNNIPTSVNYKSIDELGAFPQVKINSSTTSLETYNDEWVQVLSSNMSIDSVSIVVHYLADNESHQYLDNAFTNQTNFQIKVSLYESQDSLDQHYVILNGYISAYSDSGDQDEVYNRTYTFVAEDLLARGTAQDPPQLKQGDFGIGADGETYPQYESETPSGNSFIKVPALRTDNPINGDLGGFAFVDNGGDKTAQLAMPSEGNLGIYIKNTDNDWLSVPLKSTNDGLYVPLTRTINGKVLSSNITLSKSDIGLSAVSNDTQLKISSNLSDLANVATARTNLDVYSKAEAVPKTTTVNGQALSGNVTVTAGDVGLGNVLNAVQLVASDNLSDLANIDTARTNLDVYSKAEAVPSTLTVNGKALNTNIALTSSDTGSFNIANNLSEGVPATIRTNIGAAKSGSNSDITMLTALSGPLTLGGDAQLDGQAVTLRQLTAATAGGGSSGATLNGVMNNFLGAVEWFNGSRAALPAGHVAADGQILNRADYPDLWNAINTGVFKSVTEANWQTSAANRGTYSTGDGSTTFRMPDLNGVQTNSITAPFLRGDSGLTVGNVQDSQLGSHTHTVPMRWFVSSGTTNSNAGSFASDSSSGGGNVTSSATGGTETRPKAVVGIWLIRVNGMFSASNTNFNVINGITAAPATGAVVYGGDVISNLQLNGYNYAVARMRSKIVGGSSPVVALGLADSTGSSVVNTEWTLPATGGQLALSTDSRFNTVNGKTGGTISSAIVVNGPITVSSGAGITKSSSSWVNETSTSNGNNITYKTNGPTGDDYYTNDFYVNTGNFWSIRNIMVNNGGVTRVWEMRSDNSFRSPGTVYAAGTALTSDVRLKSNFEDLVINMDDIDNIKPKFYDKKLPDEPTSVTRELGLVAQELEEVLPFVVSEYYWNDEYPDLKTVNYASLTVWAIEYIKLLKSEIQLLQDEIKLIRNELNNK